MYTDNANVNWDHMFLRGDLAGAEGQRDNAQRRAKRLSAQLAEANQNLHRYSAKVREMDEKLHREGNHGIAWCQPAFTLNNRLKELGRGYSEEEVKAIKAARFAQVQIDEPYNHTKFD